MKKFLLSMAVALMAVCTQAETIELTPTAPNAYWGSKCVGMGTVDFSSQWGEFVLGQVDPTVYSSVKIEYSNAADVQFKVASPSEVYGEIAAGEGTASIDISSQASSAKVELQGTAANAKITVTKLIFVKVDNTEEVQENLGSTVWGCSFSSNNLLFTHESGELGFTSYPAWTEGKKLAVTITFDAAPGAMTGEVIVPETSNAVTTGKAVLGYEDKYYVYLANVEEGATTYTFEIDYEYSSFFLKSAATMVNKTLSNINCTVDVVDASSLETIESTAVDSVVYNLHGQKVNEAKGLLIKNNKTIFVK